jgi:hypothetical protein
MSDQRQSRRWFYDGSRLAVEDGVESSLEFQCFTKGQSMP